jgi:L-alanine-DL-glutamate epimerase-like enolase superfamily enzyme
LNKYNIHSIEQPIKPGQWSVLHELCQYSPIPIALDEEIIGVKSENEKEALIDAIRPQYLILKPSLIGGLSESNEWISLSEKYNCNWWATSALESNIGLNAIAQWVGGKQINIPQGLGTGSLFTNNIEMPLAIKGDFLWHLKTSNLNKK